MSDAQIPSEDGTTKPFSKPVSKLLAPGNSGDGATLRPAFASISQLLVASTEDPMRVGDSRSDLYLYNSVIRSLSVSV